MTWHRIDDPENPAPKDGTKVRVAAANSRGDIWWPHAAQFIDGAWMADFGHAGMKIFEPQPTHWQLLPNPPEKERT